MTDNFKLSRKVIDKIKSEILSELESREQKLDSDSVNYILDQAKRYAVENAPRLDQDEIVKSLLRSVVLSEEEKKLAYNKDRIFTSEVRKDFIDDILSQIRIPKDGENYTLTDKDKADIAAIVGKPKDGKDYILTDQDRLDIAGVVNLKEVIKVDQIPAILQKYTKDIWDGKVRLPRHGSKNPYEQFLKVTPKGDDKGLRVENGQLSVGSYDSGQESVFGQGDSHTTGMVALITPDGINFTDVTNEAASDNSSTYPAFGGTEINAASYIGSDEKICGIKVKISTLVDPGSGTVAREYWNGSTWDTFTALATNADSPYEQRADDIGTVIGSEQVRFGSCDDQEKTTINGHNKYWIRLRITSPITSDGTNEQIKLHTSRFEVNADGFTEYFGDAIYQKDLIMHWGLTQVLTGFSPLSATINFASGLSLTYSSNQFNNGQTSGRGGLLEIPTGMDTSKGVVGEILFIPLSDVAGDILFQADTYQTKEGGSLTVANSPTTQQAVYAIPATSSNILQKLQFTVNVQNLLPGEVLAFGLKRIGGDVLDTYTGNIAIINVRATGSFWHP